MAYRTRLFGSRPAEHDLQAPLLKVSHVTVRYNGALALDDISFELAVGERMAIVGPNGAGKSTLFKVIAGVLEPTSGEINVAGHCPGGHICIAYLPQRSAVDWSFPVTVADVVMMGRTARVGLLRRPGREDRELVQECLKTVGMADLADRQISNLSGGQQQRMFIARALAQEAELMLMDEPLSGLDVHAQEQILAILDDLRGRKVAVMVATHDLNLAASQFDRVMLLKTRILGLGRAEDALTTERLEEGYGGHLHVLQGEDGLLMVSDTCCNGGR